MGVGLEVYNSDGTLQFDTSGRLYRILTVALTSGSDGSATVSGSTGVVTGVVQPSDTSKDQPTVTVSGSTVSWSYSSGATNKDTSTKIMIAEY